MPEQVIARVAAGPGLIAVGLTSEGTITLTLSPPFAHADLNPGQAHELATGLERALGFAIGHHHPGA